VVVAGIVLSAVHHCMFECESHLGSKLRIAIGTFCGEMPSAVSQHRACIPSQIHRIQSADATCGQSQPRASSTRRQGGHWRFRIPRQSGIVRFMKVESQMLKLF
jgi:hypothetical protein